MICTKNNKCFKIYVVRKGRFEERCGFGVGEQCGNGGEREGRCELGLKKPTK